MVGNLLKKFIILAENPEAFFGKLNGIELLHSSYCLTAKKLQYGNINTIIDIGANKGKFIEACQYFFPQSKIYAFEPIKNLYNKIKSKKNVEAFNIGLWDTNEEGYFYINPEFDESSSFLKPDEDYKKEIKGWDKIKNIGVMKKRFDSLNINIKRPCFVKIDVEGGEDKVIEGFGNKLKEIDILQIEWLFNNYYEKQMKLSRIIKHLENFGFRGFLQRGIAYTDNKPTACDLIFFK